MGSTNSTVNYSLSQFIGTDKPSWLNDYDNDMFKIDAQMKLNATAAAGAKTTADTADGKADANALAISTLDSQINTAGTGLAAQVSANTTAIGTIDGEIGDTPLTTVAQTLTGAIEEVKASVPSVTGYLKYIGEHTINVTGDGVKTLNAVMNDAITALQTYLATKGANYKYRVLYASPDISTYPGCNPQPNYLNAPGSFAFTSFGGRLTSAQKVVLYTVWSANSSGYIFDLSTQTATDIASITSVNGNQTRIVIEEYEIS